MEQVKEKTFRFNTGRGYSKQGQIIEAEVIETRTDSDGVAHHRVRFADTARQIYGVLDISDTVTPRKILEEYDAGRYEGVASFQLSKPQEGQ